MFVLSKKVPLAVLTLSMFLTAGQGFAEGGNSGGGGGSICLNKRCFTMAEAGLRLSLSHKGFEGLELSQRLDIEDVVELMPAALDKKAFLAAILGDDQTFSYVEASNSKRFDQFRREYAAIIQETDFRWTGLPGGKFQLAGVSSRQKTFLLPEFEQLTSLRSKSLLLIHEGLIRTYGVSVRDALAFDGVLFDYLQDTSTTRSSKLVNVMQELKIIRLDKVETLEIFGRDEKIDFLDGGNATQIALQSCLIHSDSDQLCQVEEVVKTNVRDYSDRKFVIRTTDNRPRFPKKVYTAAVTDDDYILGCMATSEAQEEAKKQCVLDGCRGSCKPVQDATVRTLFFVGSKAFPAAPHFPWIKNLNNGQSSECTTVAKVTCVP